MRTLRERDRCQAGGCSREWCCVQIRGDAMPSTFLCQPHWLAHYFAQHPERVLVSAVVACAEVAADA